MNISSKLSPVEHFSMRIRRQYFHNYYCTIVIIILSLNYFRIFVTNCDASIPRCCNLVQFKNGFMQPLLRKSNSERQFKHVFTYALISKIVIIILIHILKKQDPARTKSTFDAFLSGIRPKLNSISTSYQVSERFKRNQIFTIAFSEEYVDYLNFRVSFRLFSSIYHRKRILTCKDLAYDQTLTSATNAKTLD